MLIKVVKMGVKIVEVFVSMIYGVEIGYFRVEDVFRFLLVLLRG